MVFNGETVTREGNKDLVGGLLATGDDLETVEFSQTTMLPNTEMFTIEPSFVKNEAGTKLRNKVVCFPHGFIRKMMLLNSNSGFSPVA